MLVSRWRVCGTFVQHGLCPARRLRRGAAISVHVGPQRVVARSGPGLFINCPALNSIRSFCICCIGSFCAQHCFTLRSGCLTILISSVPGATQQQASLLGAVASDALGCSYTERSKNAPKSIVRRLDGSPARPWALKPRDLTLEPRKPEYFLTNPGRLFVWNHDHWSRYVPSFSSGRFHVIFRLWITVESECQGHCLILFKVKNKPHVVFHSQK